MVVLVFGQEYNQKRLAWLEPYGPRDQMSSSFEQSDFHIKKTRGWGRGEKQGRETMLSQLAKRSASQRFFGD